MLGELGYPANGFTSTPAALVTEFNRRLPALAAEMPNCCVVSAKALNCRGDGLHFDTPSLREFGRRYYRAWQELAKNTEYFTAWNLPDFFAGGTYDCLNNTDESLDDGQCAENCTDELH